MVDRWTVESDGTVGGSQVLKNGISVENVVNVDFKLELLDVSVSGIFQASLELRQRLPNGNRLVLHRVNLATGEESVEEVK